MAAKGPRKALVLDLVLGLLRGKTWVKNALAFVEVEFS